MGVDRTVYVDGRRVGVLSPFGGRPGGRAGRRLVWVDLRSPNPEEAEAVVRELGPPPSLVGEALREHQRPKVEDYDGSLLVVLKTVRYVEEAGAVELAELRVLSGAGFVIAVSEGGAALLREARRRAEREPALLRRGSAAALWAILEQALDGYERVAEGLEDDVEEIEEEVFGGNRGVSRRIYELYGEVVRFQRATKPLVGVIERIIGGEEDPELLRRLRGVHNRLLRVGEQAEDFRELLSGILSVNLTLIGIDQNDQTKRISAWAAILVVPTLIASIYGMNFEHMPELRWTFGYPLALVLMVAVALALYRGFRRTGWL